MSTYHACPVAAAEMPISIRSLAGTVRTSLVTTIAGAADVSPLDFGECCSSYGGGSHKSGEENCDLHCQRGLVVYLERRFSNRDCSIVWKCLMSEISAYLEETFSLIYISSEPGRSSSPSCCRRGIPEDEGGLSTIFSHRLRPDETKE